MLLQNKTAVIYGAAGAVGGAVARAFAREGAALHLTGPTRSRVDAVANEIAAGGGTVDTAEVDALDSGAVERHLDTVVEKAGRVDVSFNAMGIPQQGVQGTPLVELSAEAFGRPLAAYPRAHFVTATAAARRMVDQRAGVILTLTATPARAAAPLVGGMAAAWAAVEAFTRTLAAELGPSGVRVVCLRPDAIPETATIDVVFGLHAQRMGMSREDVQTMIEGRTLRGRLPTLDEVGNAATFFASDRAGAITGSVANLSAGSIVD